MQKLPIEKCIIVLTFATFGHVLLPNRMDVMHSRWRIFSGYPLTIKDSGLVVYGSGQRARAITGSAILFRPVYQTSISLFS